MDLVDDSYIQVSASCFDFTLLPVRSEQCCTLSCTLICTSNVSIIISYDY